MKKKIIQFVFLSLWIALPAFAVDFETEFREVQATKDHCKIQKYLKSVSESQKNNPEYYALASNYWWGLGQQIYISTKPAEEGDLSLSGGKTGKEVGSISNYGTVYPDIPEKVHDLLVEGANRFRHRADIVVGLAHVQKELGKDDDCISTLSTLLDTASKDSERLLWSGGESLPDEAVQFLPEIMQGYTTYYFDRATPDDDARCVMLCRAIIRVFPDHPYAYNMLAAVAGANQKHEESLSYLLMAHEKAPDDPIVLLNIGDTYLRLGQKDEAVEAYSQVINSNVDESYKDLASEKLENMKK